MKDLYSVNYKTLMKEIKGDTKKWKDIPCPWIGKVNIILLKWSYYSKQTIDTIQSLSKYPWNFNRKQLILKFIQSQKKKPLISKALLKKSWRSNSFRLQIVLQWYSSQSSIVLTQKHRHRLREQGKAPRNKSTHL